MQASNHLHLWQSCSFLTSCNLQFVRCGSAPTWNVCLLKHHTAKKVVMEHLSVVLVLVEALYIA